MLDVRIWDIETYKEMFLISILNPYEAGGTWRHFKISKVRNDLTALIKYLEENNDAYWVGFNNISFDAQVVQYILDNYERWVDTPALTDYKLMYQLSVRGNEDLYKGGIINQIFDFSQEAIKRSNYGQPSIYKEENLWAKQIDLFKLHHFDNENKRTSLKWVSYMLGSDVEDMPVPFNKENLTVEEEELTEKYCINDVKVTEDLWYVSLGETDLKEYKGKNKIQSRLDFIQEFGFPQKAISWSDVKVGDELNLMGYCKVTGLSVKQVYDLKRARKPTRKMNFGDCIPDYVKFETPVLQLFHKSILKERIKFFEKQEYTVKIGEVTLTIAKGGIHSNERNRTLQSTNDYIYIDADIGSQYPNAIFKRKLYPDHLGIAWNINFEGNINRRLEYKEKGKNDIKYISLSETFKLALNGGGYGKTNDPNSWQYGPEVMFKCTIGNQFEILMLIEMLVQKGCPVVSANTDGIVTRVPTDKMAVYYEVCNEWEKIVGNDIMGKLEYAEYESIYQTSVNDYIAVKKGGSIKRKGDFKIDYLLNENKSRRVIPLAMNEYYSKGTPIPEFIRNHKNLLDFDVCVKASQDYRYEFREIGEQETKPEDVYHRLVRYILTTDGKLLLKIKNDWSEKPGNKVQKCEAGKDRVLLCREINEVDPQIPIERYNIDYQYYINKAEAIVAAAGRVKKKDFIDPNQLSLF